MADSIWLPKVIAAFPEFPETGRYRDIIRDATEMMQKEDGLIKGKTPGQTATYTMELYCPETKSYETHRRTARTVHPELFERVRRGYWRLRAPRSEIYQRAGIDMAQDDAKSELVDTSGDIRKAIDEDFSNAGALEGQPRERWVNALSRAVQLAHRFAMQRQKAGTLSCDGRGCDFDPVLRAAGTGVEPRSLMDVHHRDPLAGGERLTTMADFELLCPNCHRWRHALMRSSAPRKCETATDG